MLIHRYKDVVLAKHVRSMYIISGNLIKIDSLPL